MKKENKSMNVYHIKYSIKKEQCCPPSSYREINEVTVMAENETLAVANASQGAESQGLAASVASSPSGAGSPKKLVAAICCRL